MVACSAGADCNGSLSSGGLTRTYTLHVPASYDGSKPVALVVVLHGGGGTGAGMVRISGMDSASDRYGFVAVYPDGVDKLWSDGRGINDSRGIDDVAFMRALVKQIEGQYRIDPRRVYATGISNGGFMSQRLACDAADVFAAVAPDAATLSVGLEPGCHPSRPVPIVYFQGTSDPLVPYNGGTIHGPGGGSRGETMSAADSIARWAALDGCSGSPSSSDVRAAGGDDDLAVRLTAYSSCAGGAAVELYTIVGGGHTWPDGEQYLPAFLIGKTTRDLDANSAMWDFFQAHPLP